MKDITSPIILFICILCIGFYSCNSNKKNKSSSQDYVNSSSQPLILDTTDDQNDPITNEFTVNARVGRLDDSYNVNWTGNVTLTIGIVNDKAYAIAIGTKQLDKRLFVHPYPIGDYTFNCGSNRIVYCFNTSKLY